MPLRVRSVRFRPVAVRSTVKVNGGKVVSYVDHCGSGPAVLLLHSYLMDADRVADDVTAASPAPGGDALTGAAVSEPSPLPPPTAFAGLGPSGRRLWSKPVSGYGPGRQPRECGGRQTEGDHS